MKKTTRLETRGPFLTKHGMCGVFNFIISGSHCPSLGKALRGMGCRDKDALREGSTFLSKTGSDTSHQNYRLEERRVLLVSWHF